MFNTQRISALILALFMLASPLAAVLVTPAAMAQTPPSTEAPKADAAPVPPPMPATTKTVENPYGLENLWAQGDFVARGTLMILIIMSMGTWYVMVGKLYEQYKLAKQAGAATKSFWAAGSVEQGINNLKEGSPFRFIAESAVQATQHHANAADLACRGQRTKPFARWSRIARNRRFHRAIRRPVRHGVGHLARADRYRRSRPSLNRQSCRSSR
jgi:hypothetical protein